MANVSKLKYGDNTYDIKDASARHEAIDSGVSSDTSKLISSGAVKTYVDNAIAALPEPMIFKGTVGTGGTITSLPTAAASNEGFTYKVISNLSTPVAAKIGDTVISNGSAWTVIPSGDEPSGTVTSVKIQASSPISIDNSDAITTSGTRTISHANSGATAGSYGDSTAQTPGYGSTFKVPYITVNATGHVTGISEHTVKIPASDSPDISGKVNKSGDTMTGNLTVPSLNTSGGRVYNAGDDEGIVIAPASNNYAGLTLGSASGARSVFYFTNSSNPSAFWRYNGGSGGTSYDITHPKKSGTIALTSHTHDYTPAGSVSSSFLGSAVTSGATGSGSRADVSTPSHTHSVTAGGSVSSSFSGNEVSTGKPVGTSSTATYTTSVANGDHTHSYTPAGSVSSSFSGSAVTSGKPDTTNVTSVASSGHTHTTTSTGTASADSTNKASVAKGDHTHSVTAAGSVSSTFTGTAVTSGANSGSAVAALITPTYDSTTKSLTFSTSNVAPNGHTHSVTAAGSVSSTFTGSAVTSGATASGSRVDASTAGHTHSVSVSGTSGGPSGTTSLPNTNHTHSVTASGSVSSSFSGTAATIAATGTSSRTAIPNADHIHKVTATGSVSSTFTGTAVTSGSADTTNKVSVAKGDHTHSVTASGSVSSTFSGSAGTTGTAS